MFLESTWSVLSTLTLGATSPSTLPSFAAIWGCGGGRRKVTPGKGSPGAQLAGPLCLAQRGPVRSSLAGPIH